MQTASTCGTCQGAGKIVDHRPKEADVKWHGIFRRNSIYQHSSRSYRWRPVKSIRKGNDAPGDGIPGDILVVVQEVPHDKLKREGNNLHHDMYISFSEAALGTTKEIDTLPELSV
ncbi:MAG: DnaJ C-terminal domain-containing protein [Flavobacteriaceae bacterium]|nr:DnaJ C-terminal domain-containing protein [Flavobacteriaceae bacterium]